MEIQQIKNKIAEYKNTTLSKTVKMTLLGRLYSDNFILKGKEKTYLVRNNRVISISELTPEDYEGVKNLLEINVSLVIQNNRFSSVTQDTYAELADLFEKNRDLEAIEKEIEFFNSIS